MGPVMAGRLEPGYHTESVCKRVASIVPKPRGPRRGYPAQKLPGAAQGFGSPWTFFDRRCKFCVRSCARVNISEESSRAAWQLLRHA
ncbi:hypothetical protein [Achromobacter spanius]|uniref:hypothetical protein n=1 Tax=Achromobacter spanius TaxID=217203 RepID=UPI0038138686